VFEYLEGEVAGRGPARLVLDVAGVGYELCIPLSAQYPARGRARVWTHVAVRDGEWTLYGFPDPGTRAVFRALLSVRGIGPGHSLSILSHLEPARLLDAVIAGELALLTSVKGLGKKRGEQILLDLRERAPRLRAELGLAGAATPSRADTAVEDAVAALVSIGYTEKEAKQQVEGAAARVGTLELESLVRAALAG
jgi:Holliday junction DNA helicase RuvA